MAHSPNSVQGANSRLRLVLHQSVSMFDDDTLDDYKNGRAVIIGKGQESTSSDTTGENEPNDHEPPKRPPTRKNSSGS